MPWLDRIIATIAALAAGAPVGILLVQLLCTTPMLGYCGGHERASASFLAGWAVSSVVLWFVFAKLLHRRRQARLPVIRAD
jgi:hypothetical protein